MNLLSLTYQIVRSHGGPLPLNLITQMIKSSKEFDVQSRDELTPDKLAEIIVTNGKNIWLDVDLVKIKQDASPNISSLFVQLSDAFRMEPLPMPELLALGLIFYKRLTDINANYPLSKTIGLIGLNQIEKINNSKQALLSEFNKMNNSVIFDRSAGELITHLETVSPLTLKLAIMKLQGFDLSLSVLSNKQFARQFDKMTVVAQKVNRADYEIPPFIREIISSIAIKLPFQSVYDPFFTSPKLFDSIFSKSENHLIHFTAEGTFSSSLLFQRMSSFLYELNSLSISKDNALFHSKTNPESFDLIVSHPPFGGSMSLDSSNLKLDYAKFGITNDITSLYIQLILSRLKQNGRAIIVVSNTFLTTLDKVQSSIREYLIEQDLLEFVIYLPSGVYQSTPLSSNIIVINKNKETKNKVAFVDTTTIYSTIFDKSLIPEIANNLVTDLYKYNQIEMVKHYASNLFIKQNNYQFQVPLYVNSYLNKLELLKKQGAILEVLKNVLQEVYLESFKNQQPLKFITPKDLSKDVQNPYIKIENLPFANANDEGKIINQDAVIITKIGGKLNPSIFKYSGESVVANNNQIVLIPNKEKIHLEYLVQILNNEIVKEQINSKIKGTAHQFYRIDDIKSLVIPLPSLEEQLARVVLSESSELSKLQSEIEAIAKDKTQTEYAILSSLKHSFGQKPFNNYLLNIEYYISNSIENKKVVRWNDKLTEHPASLTLKNTLDSLFSLVKETGDLFTNMKDLFTIDNTPVKFEEVEIIKLIKEAWNETEGTDNVEPVFPEVECNVNVDKVLFKQLISNLITNSIKHGFRDKKSDEKMIIFDIRSNVNENKWVLNYYNNGNNFPEGYFLDDFITFGSKGANSAGSGIGGHLMNRIVEKHQGSFSFSNIEMEGNKFLAIPVLGLDDKGQTIEVNSLLSGGVKFRFIFNTININE
jgi:type I restriction-modification system DNA methylase subunit